MKILLIGINAKYIHSNPAIYSLRSCVGQYKDMVEIAEYTINQRAEEIRQDIYLRKPDVLAFSCYIWNIALVGKLLPDLGRLLPEVPIWLGGPEVSYRGEALLEEFPQVTGVMQGEGEYTFYKLAEYYASQCMSAKTSANRKEVSAKKCVKKNDTFTKTCRENDGLECVTLQKIPGIVTRAGNTGVPKVLDLSDIPFWYGEGDVLGEEFKNRIVYYESSRGCPFRCAYCLSSIDKTVRFRSMDMVKKELAFFLDNRIAQVKFIDRTFNCKHSHAMEIWRFIKEKDNGVTNFHFEIAADLLNDKEIELLTSLRPGLVQLEIGVQTTNPKTLEEIQRNTDMVKLADNVAELRKAGNIHLHLDLIAGLPYEEKASFISSFHDVYAMAPDELQLGFLKVLSGSYMGEKTEEYGILYEKNPPYEVLSTNWISYEDVIGLKRVEEMLELYYNSRQFVNTIAFLERRFAAPFAMYQALADFYERKGYFVQTPSRSYRYDVLLDFVRETDAANEEIYKELLTFDLYLREKVKSRPAFVEDRKQQEELVWNFYKKEEQEPILLKEYAGFTAKQMMNMTHLEYFKYPVWDMDALQKRADRKLSKPRGANTDFEKEWVSAEPYAGAVFFDYKHRNPITGNANISVINF